MAALFSILATLALWKLNPRKWLTWYFEHCAAAGGRVPTDIRPLLPWNLSAEKKKSLGESGSPRGKTRPSSTARRIPTSAFQPPRKVDPVPPQGTLDRFLLRTEQTGWAVLYFGDT